ncbi:MAG: hypothetical protein ABI790_05410 [Betaproteobacteria bacterium]
MATPAYTHFDSANPVGTQNGPAAIISMLNNLIAERNQFFTGKVKDFVFERANGAGTADDPQFFFWKNATTSIWFRATNTWVSGKLTTQTWDWSNDAGATYASVFAADANTFDAAYNITASTLGSSFGILVIEAIAKVRKVIADLVAHLAGSGTGVHGLGSMSTQNANAVAITGGAVNATVGVTTRNLAEFTRTTEGRNTYAPTAAAAQAIDWALGSSLLTTNGVNVLSFANVPATGMIASHILDTSNHNNTTYPAAVDWGLGGKPGIAGRALVSLVTLDGGAKVFGGIIWRAV